MKKFLLSNLKESVSTVLAGALLFSIAFFFYKNPQTDFQKLGRIVGLAFGAIVMSGPLILFVIWKLAPKATREKWAREAEESEKKGGTYARAKELEREHRPRIFKGKITFLQAVALVVFLLFVWGALSAADFSPLLVIPLVLLFGIPLVIFIIGAVLWVPHSIIMHLTKEKRIEMHAKKI